MWDIFPFLCLLRPQSVWITGDFFFVIRFLGRLRSKDVVIALVSALLKNFSGYLPVVDTDHSLLFPPPLTQCRLVVLGWFLSLILMLFFCPVSVLLLISQSGLAVIKRKHDDYLVRDLVMRLKYKRVVRCLSQLFTLVDRCYVCIRSLPSLNEVTVPRSRDQANYTCGLLLVICGKTFCYVITDDPACMIGCFFVFIRREIYGKAKAQGCCYSLGEFLPEAFFGIFTYFRCLLLPFI